MAYDALFDEYEGRAQAGDATAVRLLNAINQARDVLVDPVRRAELDTSLVEKETVTPPATGTQRTVQKAALAAPQEERARTPLRPVSNSNLPSQSRAQTRASTGDPSKAHGFLCRT